MKTIRVGTLLFWLTLTASGQSVSGLLTDANEVMAKMSLNDAQREMLSQGYAGRRLYILDNERMHKHSELLVEVQCDPAGAKHFEVVSEEGWSSANKHVLKKMLESEVETSGASLRPKTRLTADNYNFSLAGTQWLEGRPTYVIDVVPKRADKYLFEGRIWVDGHDYALVRVEGRPARNPSAWTRSVHFTHQYQQSAGFWFPSTTESVTQALVFGRTEVTIRYFDYRPNTASVLGSNPRKASFKERSYVEH